MTQGGTDTDTETDSATGTRLEFATPAWFTMFGQVLADVPHAPPADGGCCSFSEFYLDVPRGVAGHDEPVGWTVVVDDAQVSFRPQPDAAADIVIEVDYAFARDMMEEYDSADPESRRERKNAMIEATKAGKFKIRGDLRRSPTMLTALHDVLAARTVQP
jgi:hypothetical protein